MTAERIKPGQIVVSRAGRDAGQCYVVIALRGDSRAALADGTRRRVQNPKIKNLKHLRFIADPDPDLERKMSSGERVSDADIRRVLWVWVEKEGCQ